MHWSYNQHLVSGPLSSFVIAQKSWKITKIKTMITNLLSTYICGICLNKNCDHPINGTKISKWLTNELMSSTQQKLLEKLAMSFDSLPNLLICNIITNAVNKHPTPLHVALSVYYHRHKTIIQMHDYLAIAWETRNHRLYVPGVAF